MYKKTRYKRIRIKVLQFFELIILPLSISGLIMLFLFGISNLLGFRFSSWEQMVGIILLIVVVVGGIIFEISRIIIKKILHYPTLDFFEKMLKKLFKRGNWLMRS